MKFSLLLNIYYILNAMKLLLLPSQNQSIYQDIHNQKNWSNQWIKIELK